MNRYFCIILSAFFYLFSIETLSMPNNDKFSQEQQLPQKYKSEIKDFWQQGLFSSFQGSEDIRINYANFQNSSNTRCLVIVPGRTESYLKYQELSFDLFHQGYNLFIIDHRGQGLSERMLKNPYKGYVESFEHYAADLHQFISTIVVPQCRDFPQNPYLLAHSMGGAITLRMMQNYQVPLQSVVLSSPMIAISSGVIPKILAKLLITSLDKVNHWTSEDAWYFIAQQDYKATPFSDNVLSQSTIRYQNFIELYQQNKSIQLGGVTSHWLHEAIKTESYIFQHLNKLNAPILVLQSGDDSVVDNEIQNNFCRELHQINKNACPNGNVTLIEDAKHELLFEQDKYRNQAISNTLKWFDQFQ